MCQIAPQDVFTPRSSEVNDHMYVQRPDLESALKQGFASRVNMIIHGESGCGKSWLYKKVFKELSVETLIANMANASRFEDLNNEFQNLVARSNQTNKTGYSEGSASHQEHYKLLAKDPFERVLELLRAKAGERPACLVVENLESILEDNKIKKQICDVIILLDDAAYSKYGVSLALVGVPNDIQRFFSELPNITTVFNRVREIPEVSRLTKPQAIDLIERGLASLKYSIDSTSNRERIIDHIIWVTDRIPQQLHEYCLELTQCTLDKNRIIAENDLDEADRIWTSTSLTSNYTVIESVMNARETKVGRRNQTLYAIGKCSLEEFGPGDIVPIVRREFPTSTASVTLNIPQMLSELVSASELNPIIRKTPKGDAFKFTNPKFRMCIRTILKKNGEVVEKVPLMA